MLELNVKERNKGHLGDFPWKLKARSLAGFRKLSINSHSAAQVGHIGEWQSTSHNAILIYTIKAPVSLEATVLK